MKLILLFVTMICTSLFGCAQSGNVKDQKNKHIGGICEGCEAIYESPVPFEQLNNIDTLPDFNDRGPKIEISGVIYQQDGKTPAPGVVLYVYHTDQTGVYPAKRHGYIRGWIKTGKDGFYKFYTLLPASYPNSKNPKHIHPTVKEPDKNEYWIDEYLFDGDPYLRYEKSDRPPRGSNGIIKLVMRDGILRGTRNIILGSNVPDYPKSAANEIKSGLAIGANCPAFDPVHLSGPDKGKSTCPMCKYGYGQGIMVWINHSNLSEMNDFVKRMEKEMIQHGEKKLRVFMVYMNPEYKKYEGSDCAAIQEKVRRWCEKQKLDKVAVVWVPSPVDGESSRLFKINAEAKNTVFIYKKRKVAAKWVNLDYTEESATAILEQL
jgi:protocatechuate 3,4-dioxygenase beta subunit